MLSAEETDAPRQLKPLNCDRYFDDKHNQDVPPSPPALYYFEHCATLQVVVRVSDLSSTYNFVTVRFYKANLLYLLLLPRDLTSILVVPAASITSSVQFVSLNDLRHGEIVVLFYQKRKIYPATVRTFFNHQNELSKYDSICKPFENQKLEHVNPMELSLMLPEARKTLNNVSNGNEVDCLCINHLNSCPTVDAKDVTKMIQRSRLPICNPTYKKPKLYCKKRIRLKPTFLGDSHSSTFNYIVSIFIIMMMGLCRAEIKQSCLGSCTCGSYAYSKVSSPSNMWPSMLTSSLLSEAYSVPLRHPTTFDALVNSLLSPDPSYDPSYDDKSTNEIQQMGSNVTPFRMNNKIMPAKPPNRISSAGSEGHPQLLPGEVFINCRDRGLSVADMLQYKEPAFDSSMVVKIDLSSNILESLEEKHFQNYPSTRFLYVNNNNLSSIEPQAFPEHILLLSLENNHLQETPLAVKNLSKLRILDLAGNQLTELPEAGFFGLSRLALLSLHHNKLYSLHPDALLHLSSLQILDLANNNLPEVPTAVRHCTTLRQLLVGNNRISYIGEDSLFGLHHLQWVDLQGNPIVTIDSTAFANLPSLVKLILESTRKLSEFPSLNGTSNLEALRIDRSSLTSIPDNLCSFLPKLRSLNVHLNEIEKLPDLSICSALRLLDMSNNVIGSLGHKPFVGVPLLHDLLLQYNEIKFIPNDAFTGLPELQMINLEYNQITVIEPDAFLPLVKLEDINLGNNEFSELPSVGLEHVVSIKVHNNRNLRVFPDPESFPAVHTLVLSYAYHCCPFLHLEDTEQYESSKIQEYIIDTVEDLKKFDADIWNNSHVLPHMANALAHINGTSKMTLTPSVTSPSSLYSTEGLHGNGSGVFEANGTFPSRRPRLYKVQCIPQPGPFMPCRDLFDWWTLRCGVWLVFLLALMGNGVVVVVLVSAYSKMDVPRFLVSNLALADFFMGIYLGFLAVVDASTLGDFKMYAIPWQMSVGCQLAGFLGVLSSELSVYTLAVITMERNYAITHAMHLNKRLSLKHAAIIMAIGWMFAVTMAILPLTGVSDYRKFAVCLPFETDGAGLGYVVFLMVINGVAFLILMGCYLKIYCAIRGSQAWNSNDSRIAKRMALLVFTDFICWAPIAFFSLSAAFGLQLISLEEAKVFTVFILPLNSCCNPFLYALLTKQFKKDCVMLCKAIEESRVTRGIGRCRHSSNFSNRQTPANTNSALEQNSKEEQQSCNCKQKEQISQRGFAAARALRYFCCKSDRRTAIIKSKSPSKVIRSPLKVVRASALNTAKPESPWNWKVGSASTLRLLELRRQNTLDLTRKSSQESSLSSSRNDSSGTSGSTVTWRISRSSVSSDTSSSGVRGGRSGSLTDKNKEDVDNGSKTPVSTGGRVSLVNQGKPRLQRQRAVEKDPDKGNYPLGNELRCPLHSRGDNLSCVYEQASLEEEDSNDVFVSAPACLSHRRSLSDGILCGALLSLSAPTPQFVPCIAPKLPISRSLTREVEPKETASTTEAKSDTCEERLCKDDNSRPEGLLETHFPVDDVPTEGHPLLRQRSS